MLCIYAQKSTCMYIVSSPYLTSFEYSTKFILKITHSLAYTHGPNRLWSFMKIAITYQHPLLLPYAGSIVRCRAKTPSMCATSTVSWRPDHSCGWNLGVPSWHWKIDHVSLIFLLNPPLTRDFPLPCLIYQEVPQTKLLKWRVLPNIEPHQWLGPMASRGDATWFGRCIYGVYTRQVGSRNTIDIWETVVRISSEIL